MPLTEEEKTANEQYKICLLEEALERISPERKRIEKALMQLGHDPRSAFAVENAIKLILGQPTE